MDTELLLISTHENPADRHWLEKHSAQLGFPAGARVLDSLETLLAESETEKGAAQVVALYPSQSAFIPSVEGALDAQQLVRWPVYLMEGERDVDRLAERLKTTVAQHALRRENARLRADLKAVARRVNHDLRSPIGGITTTAELLKELLGESAPDLVSLTEPLFDSTQSMVRLVDRVSFVSRATAEQLPKAPVAMGEVVWAAEQRLQRNLMKAGVTVQYPSSWPEVEGVAAWLEVIWWNLLVNAIDHAGPDKSVKIYWEQEDDASGGIRFGVRDGGKGVPEGKRGSLYKPFHLLHLPNSPHGLGLPIVRRLVELQGGTCGYEFPETGGAAFYFILPGGA